MIFLVLFAYLLVIDSKNRVHNYLISAVVFGCAILTKENAIFFIPAFLYSVYFTGHFKHNRVMLVNWVLVTGYVVSFYFLFALLKSEFFPSGTRFGGSEAHVSLIETLKFQALRDGGSVFHPETSSFWKNALLWFEQDKLLIIGGSISGILLLFFGIVTRRHKYVSLCVLSLCFWWFLVRGGVVIEFYVTPLIPILAIQLAVFVTVPHIYISQHKLKVLLGMGAVLLSSFYYYRYGQESRAFAQNNTGHRIYSTNQTRGQLEAVKWIDKYLDEGSVIIIDNYSYLDLRYPDDGNYKVFNNAHSYWKVDNDKDVKQGVLKNTAQNIDYIAVTPQMRSDLEMGVSKLVTTAINSSILVKSFNTSGWGVEIWATRYPKQILNRSWESYKQHFIKHGAYVVDPSNNTVTSEGQSYALLRSVWINDKKTFDDVWNATKNKLLNEHGTVAWNSTLINSSKIIIKDKGSATDGDTDIALALIFAYKKWGQEQYLNDARTLLDAIWQTEVKEFNGKNYLVPGPWAKDKEEVVINPSYLSPYAYRIFAQVDSEHPWMRLVDTSYEMLSGCTDTTLNGVGIGVGLPPNWCALTQYDEFIQNYDLGLSSTEYSFDAVRTMWRIALDYKWYKEPRAKQYLIKSSEFFKKQLQRDGKIYTGYTHSGDVFENYESVLGYSFVLSNFMVTNNGEVDDFYKDRILKKFYEDFDLKRSYWEDPDNYYTQNWAWFNTALYAEMLPNLWND